MSMHGKRSDNSVTDLKEALVSIRRVSKVVKGGRRFSFSVLVVVGDGRGRVGCGLGKHSGVADARIKAVNMAKSNMRRVRLKEGRTLHHDVVAKFCSAKIILRSAKPGTGVIAGGAMRSVFNVVGVKDVVAKSVGASSNPANVVYAMFNAFNSISYPRYVSAKRNKKLSKQDSATVTSSTSGSSDSVD